MQFSVLFFGILLSTALPHVLPDENAVDDIEYFLYEDEFGNIQTEYLKNVPINLTASATDIIYYYYSKSNPSKEVAIYSNNIQALSKTAFNANKESIFIIHGWKNSRDSDVNSHIREYLLKSHDVNVFVVDWGKIAGKNYASAQGNVLAVGQFVGAFVSSLQSSFRLQLNKVKFVGHSLGAHVSGCAGAALHGKVDRIVGLDPAGPLFNNNNKNNRIHAGNAQIVQIIHTNGGKLGYKALCGDIDFFPNGGQSQPGCGTDATGSCAHSRAYALYAESLSSKKFVGQKCSQYSEYTNGKCSGPKSVMGMFNVEKGSEGSYFLTTNNQSPYAKG